MKTLKEYMNEKRQVIRVYYHDDMDGMGSAYAVWKKLGNKARYRPVNYDNTLLINKDDLVYMVDFSVKKKEMLKYSRYAERIVVIDHHKTAQADLVDLPDNVEVNFNMSKSGAVLTWEYFHKSKVPEILLHIQDRDIWQWKIKGSKGVNLWLDENITDFRQLDKLPLIKDIIAQGESLVIQLDKDVDKAVATTYEVEFEGYTVGVVEAIDHGSEIGNKLAKKYKFGVVLNRPEKKVELRSVGSFDVSDIAKKYGGGGHKNAAGFPLLNGKVPWE